MLDNSLNVADDSGHETFVQLPMSVVAKKLAEIRDNRDALIARHELAIDKPKQEKKTPVKREKRRPKLKFTDGFFTVPRSLANHPAIKQTGAMSDYQAAADLSDLAVFKDKWVTLWDGKPMFLKRGQLCYSRTYLAERWGWKRSAVTRFLERLAKPVVQTGTHDAPQNRNVVGAKPERAPCKTETYITMETIGRKCIITLCHVSENAEQTGATQQAIQTQGRNDAYAKPERAPCETGTNRNKELKKKDNNTPLSPNADDGDPPVIGVVDSFDLFWAKVPSQKKKDKPRARAAFQRCVKNGQCPQMLALEYVRHAQAHLASRPEGEQTLKFFKDPTSWLNAEAWDNPLPEKHNNPRRNVMSTGADF